MTAKKRIVIYRCFSLLSIEDYEVRALGYVNLDFLGNLGHSIEKDKSNRIYVEKGNTEKLSSEEAFTFEPHIGLPGSPYGFKMENIYTFENGRIIEL